LHIGGGHGTSKSDRAILVAFSRGSAQLVNSTVPRTDTM